MQSCKPSLDEVKKLSSKGNLVPIYKEIEADLEVVFARGAFAVDEAQVEIADPATEIAVEGVAVV